MGEYVTKEDFEEFKKQLINDLKCAESQMKEPGNGKILVPVMQKWFHDTRCDYAENNKKAFKKFFQQPHIWRVWDAIRGLTSAVCGSKTVAQISDMDMALDYCEKLCEFTYKYLEDRRASDVREDTAGDKRKGAGTE